MRIAAIDIGGTSIKSGIWDGESLSQLSERPTEARLGGAHVMDIVKEILHGFGSFDAIGISTAGQVNSKEGYIRYANENIPGYTGTRIRDIMEAEFCVPVTVENDVNSAAIGEAGFGAGKDEAEFLCITYGTGVGGAIVINHSIYTGSSFSAAEFGGILVHPEDKIPGDPFSGCYEKYASTTGLVKRAIAFDGTLDNGRKIFARLEEAQVKAVVDGWIDEIVYGLHSLIHIFNPSCIVLGGGIMEQEYVIQEVRNKTVASVMESFSHVRLVQAKLGNRAGLLGAAYLAGETLVSKEKL